MSDLQYISFAVFLFAILFGFIVNLIYFRLCRDSINTDSRRVSLSVLKKAIADPANKPYADQLVYCRKMYIAYLVILYVAIGFVAYVLALHAGR